MSISWLYPAFEILMKHLNIHLTNNFIHLKEVQGHQDGHHISNVVDEDQARKAKAPMHA